MITVSKNLLKRIRSRVLAELEARVAKLESDSVKQTREINQLRKALELQTEVATYLQYECSRLSSVSRHICTTQDIAPPFGEQSRGSFDFQWNQLPESRYTLTNEEFRTEVVDLVLKYTGLDKDWFQGKSVIDVGCGSGRFSWALSELGADVLSVDQSEHGLAATRKECEAYAGHRALQRNLLEPLAIEEKFDLVWSYGVLHHTGDLRGSFERVHPLAKVGGYFFLMLYGEPRYGKIGDYRAVNEYEEWRAKTRSMTLQETYEAICEGMAQDAFHVKGEEYIHGYFDAISPMINDLIRYDELEFWMTEAGFEEVNAPFESNNHHVIGRRVADV